MENSKIKVLWFSNTPANGILGLGQSNLGSGTWLRTLDLALQEKVDLNIVFLNSNDKNFKFGKTNYFALAKYKNSIQKFRFKLLERFFDYVLDDELIEKYLEVIDSVKPDLIHIHGTENSFGCIIGKTSIPVVISIQGLTSAVSKYYSVGLGEKYLAIRNFSFNNLKDFFFPTNFNNALKKFNKMRVIECKNLLNCLHIIGRTEWDLTHTRIMAPSSSYYHVDEIMRTQFYNSEWSPNKSDYNTLTIHTTSDNVYYKGLETVCEVVLVLINLGYNCTWNVAGVSENDLIVKIVKKKFGKKFPTINIKFLGKLSEENLLIQMLKADCFVMPSNIENSSNALCEAMLLGMPCIATNAGGTNSILKHRIDGILVQIGDSTALASGILELYKDQQFSKMLGKNARSNALNRHSKDKVVSDVLNTYHLILSSK